MSSRLQQFDQLDALRTVAALLVILYHFLPEYGLGHLPYGWIGVDLFFVISGFLITAILLRQKEAVANKPLLIRNFVIKRALRLFPVYYALLIGFSLLQAFVGLWSWYPGQGIYFYTYTSNLLFFQEGFRSEQLNHVWSLAVEEQFYLLWPWLVLFLSRTALLRAVVTMVVLSFLFKTFSDLPHVRMLTISHFDTLGGGALIAILGHTKGLFARMGRWSAGLVFLGLSGFAVHSLIVPHALVLNASVLLLSVTVVNGCLHGFGGAWGALLDQRWMIHAGRISYGLYLFHKPIPVFTKMILARLGIEVPGLLLFVLSLAATFVIAELSFRVLERPFLRLKERFDL